MTVMRPRGTGGKKEGYRRWRREGMVERVESVMPRLMTHCGEALREEMNEGGEERRAGIGG